MAETVAAFWSGGSTREVLLLVPELLFFAFSAVVALDSGFVLVAFLRSDERSRRREYRKVSGESRLRVPFPAAPLLSVVVASILAATVVPVLLISLKLLVEAPVKVVIAAAAAAAAAATVVLAVVVSVVVLVVTMSVAVGALELVLVMTCQRVHKCK